MARMTPNSGALQRDARRRKDVWDFSFLSERRALKQRRLLICRDRNNNRYRSAVRLRYVMLHVYYKWSIMLVTIDPPKYRCF